MKIITTIAIGVMPLLSIVFLALLAERLRPAERQSVKSTRFNLAYTVVYSVLQGLIVPIVSAATVMVVNRAGGGWINLPSTGWSLIVGFLAYAFAMDGMEYFFHRAQHRLPVLWAMHSFHHSDQALNASSTSRHYWAENAIKILTVYLAVGLFFKTNSAVLGLYGMLSFYHVFAHMNLRIGFGRWAMLMNSPQYHRIHHSVRPEHYDCNFAGLFPLFDVLFRTYRQPGAMEYPPTGLDTGEVPSGIADTLFWPIRKVFRFKASAA